MRGIRAVMVAAAAVLVGVTGLAAPAAADPGSLDPTFSGDGKIVTDPTSGPDAAYSLTLDADGKVLVVGRANGAGGRMFVQRYTAVGALDPMFSGDGQVFLDFSPNNDFANGVAVEPDGDIVIVGGANDAGILAAARLDDTGVLDPTFSGDGRATFNLTSGADLAAAVALQADGAIVMSGLAGGATAVMRLTDAGLRDVTFGTNGLRTRNLANSEDVGIAVDIDGDGNIVVAGSTAPGASAKTSVLRFQDDGTNDTTFSGDGSATLDVVPGGYEDATEVLVQPDGSVVVAGEADGNLSLLRFDDAGVLDPTFSGDGKVRTNLGGPYEFITGLGRQADGALVVSGARVVSNRYQVIVGRYLVDGTVDTTFNAGTAFTTRNLSPGDEYATELVLQDDGKIVVSAFVNNQAQVGVLRFDGN